MPYMPRQPDLYEATEGNLLLAYLQLCTQGKNVPPNRARSSRAVRKTWDLQANKLLQKGKLNVVNFARDWELAYKKEYFYRGLRTLFDLHWDEIPGHSVNPRPRPRTSSPWLRGKQPLQWFVAKRLTPTSTGRAMWLGSGPARKQPIYLVQIPPFFCRGMRRIYGRSDKFALYIHELLRSHFNGREIDCYINCKLDVWQRKDGRIFIRFYATRKWLDRFFFELLGHPSPPNPKDSTGVPQKWVPEVVRDEYHEWIRDCLAHPDNE
jgi:hypothetical protein